MSRDLRRLYAELGDIDPRTLPAPDVLRGRADRRARNLVVAGCFAIALLVGGTAVAVNAAFVRTQAPPQPGTSVSVTPTPPEPSPVSSAPPPTGPIPDSAFFTQPKERENNMPDAFHAVTKMNLPSLCGATFPATFSQGRNHHQIYTAMGAPAGEVPLGTVDQAIFVHRPGGAAATMQRLRDAVAACRHEIRDGATVDYTTPSSAGFGDEYVLLRQHWSIVSPPYNQLRSTISYYSVVRVGEVITVLSVSGWEDIDADRGVTDQYTGLAVTALRGWLD